MPWRLAMDFLVAWVLLKVTIWLADLESSEEATWPLHKNEEQRTMEEKCQHKRAFTGLELALVVLFLVIVAAATTPNPAF